MNNSSEYTSDILEQLDKSGNPIRRARLPKKMRLAYKIANALEAMDWKNKKLTERLGKKYQSQITRWLKGDHNFTVNTLSDIEEILGIKLLALDEIEPAPIARGIRFTLDVNIEEMQNKVFPSEQNKEGNNASVDILVAFAGGRQVTRAHAVTE